MISSSPIAKCNHNTNVIHATGNYRMRMSISRLENKQNMENKKPIIEEG
jgi:hypothetical protein